jgi:Na+-translocating ferredoxin:NAD+ oxidoreductase RnfC subunit
MHELKQVMKDAGLVGDGGAGFPSYAKLAEGADTLLINGSECEPLLYTDYILMKREMPMILAGIQSVIWSLGIKRALFCIKEHTAERLSLSDGDTLGSHITVKVMPNVYPIGDEVSLIYQATGRIIRPGNLPISKGILVYNVETMYNLGRAVRYSEPVTMKWLTVGGDVEKPVVVKVPVGTPVFEILDKLGIEADEDHTVIDGGPSMGKVINHVRASVTKTTKGILVLPNSTQAVSSKLINEKMAVSRAETACCQCTRCTDMCPRALLGYPLEPHKMVRTAMQVAEAMPQMIISATLCCGCGICETIACSQGISPKAVINNYKSVLAKNGMRFVSTHDVSPTLEREYRRIPSERWTSALGVARYDKLPDYIGEITPTDRVAIPLAKHIGAPSLPVVKDGDAVKRGDLIAAAADGLSVSQHASIDGRVSVEGRKIIIDRY